MRRREFITLLGGAAAMWPLAAIAQQADQVRRIGVLSNIGESDLEAQSMVTALHEELRKLGWIDGRNLRVDHRWAVGNPERATKEACWRRGGTTTSGPKVNLGSQGVSLKLTRENFRNHKSTQRTGVKPGVRPAKNLKNQ